jgi:hypothetical protein
MIALSRMALAAIPFDPEYGPSSAERASEGELVAPDHSAGRCRPSNR